MPRQYTEGNRHSAKAGQRRRQGRQTGRHQVDQKTEQPGQQELQHAHQRRSNTGKLAGVAHGNGGLVAADHAQHRQAQPQQQGIAPGLSGAGQYQQAQQQGGTDKAAQPQIQHLQRLIEAQQAQVDLAGQDHAAGAGTKDQAVLAGR